MFVCNLPVEPRDLKLGCFNLFMLKLFCFYSDGYIEVRNMLSISFKKIKPKRNFKILCLVKT